MADWETVRKLALSLPEVDASSSGRVAFSVRGKGFAWEARERDGGGLAVRVERDEKDLILQSNPDVYFTSPHYTGFPAVQIDVDAIGRDELWDRLEDAWHPGAEEARRQLRRREQLATSRSRRMPRSPR